MKSITYKHQNYRFRVFRQSLNPFGSTTSVNENVKLVNATDEAIFVPGLEPWRPNQIFDLPKEMALTQHVQPRILGGALKIDQFLAGNLPMKQAFGRF